MFLTMEDLCNHVNRAGECGCSSKSSTYAQSLSEMDFERGIWQAALNGDVSRVRKFLDKGTDPNSRDGLGYTALVNHVLNCPSIPSFNIPPNPHFGATHEHPIVVSVQRWVDSSHDDYLWSLVHDKSQSLTSVQGLLFCSRECHMNGALTVFATYYLPPATAPAQSNCEIEV